MDYQEAIKYFEFKIDKYKRIALQRNRFDQSIDNSGLEEEIEFLKTAISAMQELQLYKDGKLCLIPESVYSKQCTELDAYKQLGTLEEVVDAVEKQKKERIRACLSIAGTREFNCGYCGCYVDEYDVYCKWCGQRLDWGIGNESEDMAKSIN